MNKEIERRFVTDQVVIEKREKDGSELGVIEGYAAVFNKRTKIGGWFEEEILPGAFDEVLNDDVRCLINHDPSLILARSVEGKGTLELSVDEKGLKYRYTTPDISYAKDLQVSIERGDIFQSSFSFAADEVIWVDQGDDQPELRRIKKMKRLFDVSPVTYPAYEDATVAKRSWDAMQEEKRQKENPEKDPKILDEYEARYMYNVNSQKR